MKKIKYGSRDRTKQKNNHHYIDELKDGDDDVCGAVLDTLNADYLSYITNLVKSSKTPSKGKKKTSERLKEEQNMKEQNKEQIPKRVNNHSPKSDASMKNCTMPMKKIKQISQGHSYREPHGTLQQKSEQVKPLNLNKRQLLREHYNRFPTQEAEKPYKAFRNQQTSIVCQSQEGSRKVSLNEESHSRQFLTGLDEYLGNLENVGKKRSVQHRSRHRSDDIRESEQLLQENLKLRKKLRKYQDKIEEIEEDIKAYSIHYKRKEKNQKNKINQLIKNLTHAVAKINSQKQQIQTMKQLIKSFGRKAKFCAQNYESESEDLEQEINESLVKAMRPSRAYSDNKLKKKNVIPTSNFEKYLQERDD